VLLLPHAQALNDVDRSLVLLIEKTTISFRRFDRHFFAKSIKMRVVKLALTLREILIGLFSLVLDQVEDQLPVYVAVRNCVTL